MNKLSIKLENCFGIGKFEQVFDFEKSNTVLVYAPNGTMKSSLAETFSAIAKGETPRDRIYLDRKPRCDIFVDEQLIKSESILVVNAEEDFDATDKISSFIASAELKKQYDGIYSELNKFKKDLITKLKKVSQSNDCEKELVSSFSVNDNNDFFEILLPIAEKMVSKHEKFDFRYNYVFDKSGKVKKFLDENQMQLKQYFENYQNLLSTSSFFKKSKNSFGTVQAKEIVKAIEDNAFFDAGHKFVLQGNTDIDSAEKLKELVEEEIKNIINAPELKAIFDEIDKKLGANSDLKFFKSTIEENHLLLIKLQNYDDFRKEVWLGYLYELKDDVITLSELYKKKKKDVEKILSEAKKEQKIWKNIIDIFNSRFYVPFHVEIENQEDIILKEGVANLVFKYKDERSEEPIPQEKESLLKVLSKGEKRAYHILQLLFEIESRRQQEYCSLLIFDDIADSFDYKNKYAIIEYIRDLHKSDKFKSIILTHNFGFYRTIHSRLGLRRATAVFMTVKTDDRIITLSEGNYLKEIFPHFIEHTDNGKKFISLIPFVRNVVDYLDGKESENYKYLTSCLHLKNDSEEITCKGIIEIFKQKIPNIQDVSFGDEKIVNFIYQTAQDIIEELPIDEILLENKIVLSIAIRLKAEKIMIDSLPGIKLEDITSSQTWELFNIYKKEQENALENIRILDKVILMTPENIHVNAFMYEPLIDMSVQHLVDLYKNISALKTT